MYLCVCVCVCVCVCSLLFPLNNAPPPPPLPLCGQFWKKFHKENNAKNVSWTTDICFCLSPSKITGWGPSLLKILDPPPRLIAIHLSYKKVYTVRYNNARSAPYSRLATYMKKRNLSLFVSSTSWKWCPRARYTLSSSRQRKLVLQVDYEPYQTLIHHLQSEPGLYTQWSTNS